jgi:hypothetical protein
MEKIGQPQWLVDQAASELLKKVPINLSFETNISWILLDDLKDIYTVYKIPQ